MNPVDFANRKIAEWQTKSRAASENADLAAFEFAEREIKTYKDMLVMVETLLKNWKLITVLVVIAIFISAWQYDHAGQYRRGRESMAAEISGRLKDAAIEKAKQDRESSAAYQSGKAVREEKERVRYVQVQKIIEKPVYRNVCVDSDGVSVINAAIADGN